MNSDMNADYDALVGILNAAFDQASSGKGKERHANGRPFDRQPIMEMGRMTGPGALSSQAMKKTQEALGMVSRGDYAEAERELLGAIIYAAAAVLLVKERVGN